MTRRAADAPAPDDVRDGFKFRSGRLSLDFGATLAKRAKPAPTELLATTADLGRWLSAAGLALKPLRATSRDLADARALREAIYRLALAVARGTTYRDEDRSFVNQWAAERAPAPQLLRRDGTDELRWTNASARGYLATLAQDAVTLLGGPLASRIRKCDGCTILFVDLSRSGARRWCSMTACGNKAKVAAFRKRAAGQAAADEGHGAE